MVSHTLLVLSRMPLISALASKCVPASISVALCCPHVAHSAPLLLCAHPVTSVYSPVTFVSRGELTGLFSCLHAPYLRPQTRSPPVTRCCRPQIMALAHFQTACTATARGELDRALLSLHTALRFAAGSSSGTSPLPVRMRFPARGAVHLLSSKQFTLSLCGLHARCRRATSATTTLRVLHVDRLAAPRPCCTWTGVSVDWCSRQCLHLHVLSVSSRHYGGRVRHRRVVVLRHRFVSNTRHKQGLHLSSVFTCFPACFLACDACISCVSTVKGLCSCGCEHPALRVVG
jgi:hypothetical protein